MSDDDYINRMAAAAASGYGSGFRASTLWVGVGLGLFGTIGKIEMYFYEIPYASFVIWFLLGIPIYLAADRGRI
jgi:hypothetical protein